MNVSFGFAALVGRAVQSLTLHHTVAPVKPSGDMFPGLDRLPIHAERFEHVVAGTKQMLVRVLIMPSPTEQISEQPLGVRASRDVRNHMTILAFLQSSSGV
ncbi:hypothetical protein BAQU_1480 [Bifidobacterium aquikefiri]|uniref:Uncharacterized protein n=1 Tax=Bifidobacterium aquikefiri TaxID=1653207 RepID=A0A261G2S9_9BIFI|nr:hypothetical protein BAQU_1480 [Bifidobacterium aquikefiri]